MKPARFQSASTARFNWTHTFKRAVASVCAGASLFCLADSIAATTSPKAPHFPHLARPNRVPAIYNKAFIPFGYDTNDRVELVLTAGLSTTCWRPAYVTVAIDEEKKIVEIGPAAYEYPGHLCATLFTEYKEVVNLGILSSQGRYQVVQQTDGVTLGTIDVRPARTDTPDDLPYAPVDQAFIYQAGTDAHVVLSGEFTQSCQTLDRVEVDVQPDVIVVLPVTRVQQGTACQPGQFQFKERTKIPDLPAKRYLLHVRSANGASVNSLFTMEAAGATPSPQPSLPTR